MPENPNNSGKYITLKEAAKLSGYAPDYLGQLIRKGKLRGKRIFLNEAWVTTEEDVKTYLASEGKGKRYSTGDPLESPKVRVAIKVLLYICLGVCVCLALFAFYAFSSIIDNALHENNLRILQLSAETGTSIQP